ncbi:MAG TPA: hypothetical protein VII70_00170 [Steroidobacteraceae bacterium]
MQLSHLLRGRSEHEEVCGADRIADFDIGAVRHADGKRTVHAEFHDAGAQGFLTGHGNMFDRSAAGYIFWPWGTLKFGGEILCRLRGNRVETARQCGLLSEGWAEI